MCRRRWWTSSARRWDGGSRRLRSWRVGCTLVVHVAASSRVHGRVAGRARIRADGGVAGEEPGRAVAEAGGAEAEAGGAGAEAAPAAEAGADPGRRAAGGRRAQEAEARRSGDEERERDHA